MATEAARALLERRGISDSSAAPPPGVPSESSAMHEEEVVADIQVAAASAPIVAAAAGKTFVRASWAAPPRTQMGSVLAKLKEKERAQKKARKEEKEEEKKNTRAAVEPQPVEDEDDDDDDQGDDAGYIERVGFLETLKGNCEGCPSIAIVCIDKTFYDEGYDEDEAGGAPSTLASSGYAQYTIGMVQDDAHKKNSGELKGSCVGYTPLSMEATPLHSSNVLPVNILAKMLSDPDQHDKIDPAILRIAYELLVRKKKAYIPDHIKSIYTKNGVPFMSDFGEYNVPDLLTYFRSGYSFRQTKRLIKQQMDCLESCGRMLSAIPLERILNPAPRKWTPELDGHVRLFRSVAENWKCELGLLAFYKSGYNALPHVAALSKAFETFSEQMSTDNMDNMPSFMVFVPVEMVDHQSRKRMRAD